tara:strand:+ start:635 stop:829 length:195 start_codon:yes stop_codon:yes gene_type:complete
MERTFKRIQEAIQNLDLGLSVMELRRDPLVGFNRALRETGGIQVPSLDDDAALIRAMLHLEAAV